MKPLPVWTESDSPIKTPPLTPPSLPKEEISSEMNMPYPKFPILMGGDHIHVAKAKIVEEICKTGIPKDITIVYKERKIRGRSTEIIVKKVGHLLAVHNISITPFVREYKFENNRCIVLMEYTLTSGADNSSVTGLGIGESPCEKITDKALQNACTLAFKHFLTQTFFIAEGEDEKEEVVDKPAVAQIPNQNFRNKALKIRDELIKALEVFPNDQEYNQRMYSKDYFARVTHPAFPEDIKMECFKLIEEKGIKNSVVI